MVDKAIGVLLSFIMLAALAVAVSNRAKTAAVLGALFAGLSNLTRASVSPVTGK
jgi:hypothetical protein